MSAARLAEAGAAVPTTVGGLLDRQVRQRPDAPYALSADGSTCMRYRDLAASCEQVQAGLRACGSRPGDTVSLVLPNGLMTLRLLLGALSGGWCINPVNLQAQPDQMRYVIAHSDCRVLFVNAEWAERVRGFVADAGRAIVVQVVEADAPAWPAATALEPASPAGEPPESQDASSALALLMYTSGTTGVPKGVMLTQANLVANALSISAAHGLGPEDRVLAVLPLYHINAFAVTMLAPLAHGGSLVMPPRFSASQFWDQALGHRCTWINLVPTMVAFLLEGPVAPPGATSSIRFCRSASSALPDEHLRAFERRFGIGIIETMGLTETVAPSFSNPLDPARRKLGSVGMASGCEARVIDGDLQPVPDGRTGEIAIRGPNVMRGYYKNDEATRAAFTPDGWLRSGDLGHRDADGFYFVTGRIKELIIKGGENIAPREIDEALLRHPAVLEAAAVGVPDRLYGQDILACIVLREGVRLDEDALRAFCHEQLGRFKTPSRFRVVSELPRGPSGKVQRLKLLERLN